MSPPASPQPDNGKWQGIARAIMELDIKLVELERQLGINAKPMSGGDSQDNGGCGQNNDV